MPDFCFIAKIVPVSIKMMCIVVFMIDKRLVYLLVTNYWSQMTKNYKLPEKFLPDSCTSSVSWMRTALTSESRFRITREESEEKVQICAFLREEERKSKTVQLLHLKQMLFFPQFYQYKAGLKFFI